MDEMLLSLNEKAIGGSKSHAGQNLMQQASNPEYFEIIVNN